MRRTIGAKVEALATGQKGDMNELLAAADLMSRGYYVYRSLAANAPCDLLAMRSGQILRVEVRTGLCTPDGARVSRGDPGKYDVLAVVDNGAVHYNPKKLSLWDSAREEELRWREAVKRRKQAPTVKRISETP